MLQTSCNWYNQRNQLIKPEVGTLLFRPVLVVVKFAKDASRFVHDLAGEVQGQNVVAAADQARSFDDNSQQLAFVLSNMTNNKLFVVVVIDNLSARLKRIFKKICITKKKLRITI